MGESKETQKERIKEEIHYRIELIKLLSIFFLTLTGGEISLFLKGFTLKTLILFIVGIVFGAFLGLLLWLQHRKVLKLLDMLEEEK